MLNLKIINLLPSFFQRHFSLKILQRGAFVSEPAILVRRVNSGSQVWSMEKLENKLIDMREMYQEYKERYIAGLVSIELQQNESRSLFISICVYLCISLLFAPLILY